MNFKLDINVDHNLFTCIMNPLCGMPLFAFRARNFGVGKLESLC